MGLVAFWAQIWGMGHGYIWGKESMPMKCGTWGCRAGDADHALPSTAGTVNTSLKCLGMLWIHAWTTPWDIGSEKTTLGVGGRGWVGGMWEWEQNEHFRQPIVSESTEEGNACWWPQGLFCLLCSHGCVWGESRWTLFCFHTALLSRDLSTEISVSWEVLSKWNAFPDTCGDKGPPMGKTGLGTPHSDLDFSLYKLN
jgi:hypothetical protein